MGTIKEEVTVEGSNVAQVETQSSDLSGTVNGKQITQLQLNGRNFTQLVTLVPGVSNQTGQDEGTVGINGNVSFSINGGRVEYNNWELDGGDNMDNGSNSTLNVYPSLEAIAEFKVLTSNYGAQYGRNGSGTVEVETKSGTNAFHGNAYEFVRNDDFNSTKYFLDSVSPYKKNDFGYTIGGPHHQEQDLFLLVAGVAPRPRSGRFQRGGSFGSKNGRVILPISAAVGWFLSQTLEPDLIAARLQPERSYGAGAAGHDSFADHGHRAGLALPHFAIAAHELAGRIDSRRPQLYRQDSRHGPLHPRFLGHGHRCAVVDQCRQFPDDPDCV